MRAALLLVLVGCAAETPPREDVVLSFVHRHHMPDGTVEVPVDISGRTFQIFLGGERYPQMPVGGSRDGTLRIRAVPDGPYVLKTTLAEGSVEYRQLDTNASTIVEDVIGRPGAAPAGETQPIHLQASLTTPWTMLSFIHAICFETGIETWVNELTPQPTGGVTSFAATFDWAANSLGQRSSLIDAAAGDSLTVSRNGYVERNFGYVLRLEEIWTSRSITQQAGVTTPVVAALAPVGTAQSHSFTVDMESFVQQVDTPGFDAAYWGVSLIKSPISLPTNFGAPLISVEGETLAQLSAHTEAYGDPFPSWPLIASGSVTFTVDDRRYHAYEHSVITGSESTFRASMRFVGDALVNGKSPRFGQIEWDGESDLTIDVPGAPQGFFVGLAETADAFAKSAVIAAAGSTITLPAEAMKLGTTYWMDVTISESSAVREIGATTTFGPFTLVRP